MANVKPRTRTLADLVDGCLDQALAAQGFAGSDVILSWDEIVGERLARHSRPIRMEWPRRRPDAATAGRRAEPAALVVRVESAFALELQHTAPVVIERVNAHYGWRCVSRIVLKQGPVRRRPAQSPEPPGLAPEQRLRLEAVIRPVEDGALRGALERLGTAILARPTS